MERKEEKGEEKQEAVLLGSVGTKKYHAGLNQEVTIPGCFLSLLPNPITLRTFLLVDVPGLLNVFTYGCSMTYDRVTWAKLIRNWQ